MRIQADSHLYAGQIGKPATTQNNSLAALQHAAEKESNGKELKELLQNVDLRNISAKEFAHIGAQLFQRGAISENAAAAFVSLAADVDNGQEKIDVIAHLEKKFASAEQAVAQGESGLGFAQEFNRESLHAVYSLDDFIQGQRSQFRVNDYA